MWGFDFTRVYFVTMGFFFLSLFLYFLFRPLLPTHFNCWMLLLRTHWYRQTDRHIHIFGSTSLYEVSAPRNAQLWLQNIYITGRIRTRIASNQAAADLRLRPRGHRNWLLWSYKLESDIGSGYVIVKWILLLNRGRLCMCTLTLFGHNPIRLI